MLLLRCAITVTTVTTAITGGDMTVTVTVTAGTIAMAVAIAAAAIVDGEPRLRHRHCHRRRRRYDAPPAAIMAAAAEGLRLVTPLTSTNLGSPSRFGSTSDLQEYILEANTAAPVTPTVQDCALHRGLQRGASFTRLQACPEGSAEDLPECISAGPPSVPPPGAPRPKRERNVQRVAAKRQRASNKTSDNRRDLAHFLEPSPMPPSSSHHLQDQPLRQLLLPPPSLVRLAAAGPGNADAFTQGTQGTQGTHATGRSQASDASHASHASRGSRASRASQSSRVSETSWATEASQASHITLVSLGFSGGMDNGGGELLPPVGVLQALSELEHTGATMPRAPSTPEPRISPEASAPLPPSHVARSPGCLSPSAWPSFLTTRVLQVRQKDFVGKGKNAVVLAVRSRARILHHLAELRPSVLTRRCERTGAMVPAQFVWKVVVWHVAVQPQWRRLERQWCKPFGMVLECTPFVAEALVHLLLMEEVYRTARTSCAAAGGGAARVWQRGAAAGPHVRQRREAGA